MSESSPITPLSDVMADIHNDTDADLLDKYLPEKKARRYALNPDRVKSRSEYDPDKHEADFDLAERNGEMLHNQSRPPVVIEREKPEHRFLVFLFAQGSNARDVFEQLGGVWDETRNAPVSGTGKFSYQHLLTIRRQAWFQKQLISYLEQCGKDHITAKLETEMSRSLEVVTALRDDTKAPASVRLQAANSLIDRFLGKAAQVVKTEAVKDVKHFEREMSDLLEEEKRLDEQTKNLNASM